MSGYGAHVVDLAAPLTSTGFGPRRPWSEHDSPVDGHLGSRCRPWFAVPALDLLSILFAARYRPGMDQQLSSGVRQVTRPMAWLVVPFVVLAGLGALQLYVFPGETERYFAWTLRPQPSATFMGAGYAAGVVLTVLSYRRQPWATTRIATYTIFVFVCAMLATTLLHLDRMHLHSNIASARVAAWLWVLVYLSITPALGILLVHQLRQPGSDPPRTRYLPGWLRLALGAEGVTMIVAGIVLFCWPSQSDRWWMWSITALSGRAIAAWLLPIGWAGLQAVAENDLDRLRPAAVTYTLLGAFWLIALARAGDEIRWQRLTAWLYTASALSVLAIGAAGWRLALRGHRQPNSTPT